MAKNKKKKKNKDPYRKPATKREERSVSLEEINQVAKETASDEELEAIKEAARNESRKKNKNNKVRAPYNFIDIEHVYQFDEEARIPHSGMDSSLFSGVIEYRITARTDIFIGADKDSNTFYCDARNHYAIPGSTMRGLIRSNAQILGFSSYEDDVDDYGLMFRDVTGKQKKNGGNNDKQNNAVTAKRQEMYDDILGTKQTTIDGKQVNILKNVKAGYLRKVGQEYYIYKTLVDNISENLGQMNYFILSERVALKNPEKFAPLFCEDGSYLGNTRIEGRDGMSNKLYRPFFFKISYRLASNGKDIAEIADPGDLDNKGVVVGTGKMNNKKVLYVIPEILEDDQARIRVGKQELKEFNIDYKSRENTLSKDKPILQHQVMARDYFKIPEEGTDKPVFYAFVKGKLYFGFTPRLRLRYDHTIKEGIPKRLLLKEGCIDFAKSIFGYSDKEGSYKSKVSFTNATALGEVVEKRKQSVVLSSPKPTYYNAYIKNVDGRLRSYNDNGFELRGIKQYWLHKEANAADTGNQNEKIYTQLKPLPAGTEFKGTIHFDNLTETELGLLLWSITLDKESLQNIGMAKAYGFGKIKVSIDSAVFVNMEKAFACDVDEFFDIYEPIDIEGKVEKYKTTISNLTGIDVRCSKQITDFLQMKNGKEIPDEENIRYMTLDEFGDNDNKKMPLLGISDISAL